MISILQAKFKLFLRKPMLMIGMTVMSIVFALLLGAANYTNINIPVYTDIENIEETTLWKNLTQSQSFEFKPVTEEEAKKMVSEGDAEAAVKLEEDSYKIVVVTETSNLHLLESYLQTFYGDLLLEDKIKEATATSSHIDPNAIIEELKEKEENPLFKIQAASFRGDDAVIIDNQLQTIFGFTLFFVIYTISYNVHNILQERTWGVWDRMILSPLKKWEMYAGNLVYSFLMGYAQVALIFFVFRYGVGVDFYGGFGKTLIVLVPYVFSIVALALFLVSVVKSTQQFNAIISLVSVSLSMLGGAYWPLEIVSSDFLLKVSNFVPIKHAMEGLKAATIYGASINELLYPISILTLMGVVLIGIGINVMERKNA
ncbi:ABC transporter permease [Fredinandcohnia sp. QZ13]|uniref:ABC transporter permease n=1 Tax=Fredinandcohnia sp. QZ13 TaxID=3073144 RepID=UPI002852FB33|nr:ABC transporter permease [Fredinandcohnia sp. QZ13]MDR4890464.1 ABC transporter permease [Fredinandcohnia sp. QZ13]